MRQRYAGDGIWVIEAIPPAPPKPETKPEPPRARFGGLDMTLRDDGTGDVFAADNFGSEGVPVTVEDLRKAAGWLEREQVKRLTPDFTGSVRWDVDLQAWVLDEDTRVTSPSIPHLVEEWGGQVARLTDPAGDVVIVAQGREYWLEGDE